MSTEASVGSIMIDCNDIDGMVEFWSDVLGLEVNLGHDHPGVMRARLQEQIERAEKHKQEAAAREEQARREKEAAAEQEAAARKQLEELQQRLSQEAPEQPSS